jgi:hypothetical protein
MTHFVLCSFVSATALVDDKADADPEDAEVSTVQVLLTHWFVQLLTVLNLLVTRCINKFNIQQLYALPTLYLCVV